MIRNNQVFLINDSFQNRKQAYFVNIYKENYFKMFKLYEHQEKAVNQTIDNINNGVNNQCIVAPTGFGKTIVASELLNNFSQKKQNTMFVVNRIELVKQSMSKMGSLDYSIIKSGSEYKNMYNPYSLIQLTMIQSWFSKKNLYSDFKPDNIIIDEIHDGHGTGRFKSLKETYPDANIIGLTATPLCDKGYLLENIDNFIQTASVKQLQKWINPQNGLPFLASDTEHYIPEIYDFSNVKTKGNDYDADALSETLSSNNRVDNIVEFWKKKAKNKKTLAFCVNLDHANSLNNSFLEDGYRSAVISGTTKPYIRERLLEWHKIGKLDVLVNVGVLTTGYDDPTLQCIILAYPTMSLRKYIQMLGRGGRTAEGKTSFIVLDFGNNGIKHGRWSDDRFFEKKGDIPKKIFEPFYCIECFTLITEKTPVCLCCGCKLNQTQIYKEREANEKELIKIDNMIKMEKEKYTMESTINLIKELLKNKNENRDAETFYNYQILIFKPENWSNEKFNKLVQSIIISNINNKKYVKKIIEKIKNKCLTTI